jgi:hypothetical protein
MEEENKTPKKYRIGWLKDIIRIFITSMFIAPVIVVISWWFKFCWKLIM